MKDFNIAKYLKENSLGSHAILGAYVDLHALKEEEVGNNKPVDEVPYVGDEEKLDGFGDTFDQVDPVEELDNSITGDRGWQYDDEDFSSERDKFDRMMDRAHEYFEKVSPIVRKTIESLRADGFGDQDIMDFLATDFSLEEEVSEENLAEVMDEENPWIKNELQKSMGAWRVFSDDGEVYWESETVPGKSIYATPGLYGKNGIVLQVKDSDMGDMGKEIVVKGTKGSYKKYSEYAADMKPILDKIQAQYKK